ncbi:Helitron helicase-like protein [Phytophthora palmivora]|uniref:Helitron helicase-like protein n=1 Tax=Phytophthora palmivora TaxID=4796 RepID=A0A2P4XNU8_9STRA|nr:Helitron helicase-like protein [Phytophthora palmivora]
MCPTNGGVGRRGTSENGTGAVQVNDSRSSDHSDFDKSRKLPGESEISCYLNNRVRLTLLQRVPDELLQLCRDPYFQKYVRAYNNMLAFIPTGLSRRDRRIRRINEDASIP